LIEDLFYFGHGCYFWFQFCIFSLLAEHLDILFGGSTSTGKFDPLMMANISRFRLSVDRKLPIVEIIYCVISVCNFTLSIVGITVSIHLMVKRKSRITLQAHGLIVSLALLISVILSAAMVILDNVASMFLHKKASLFCFLEVLSRIPNMKPEDFFIKSPTEEFFYTIVILPLGHALFLSVISGLSLGLNTRIQKVKESEKLENQIQLPV